MTMPFDQPLDLVSLKLMVTQREEKTNFLVGAQIEMSNGKTSELF